MGPWYFAHCKMKHTIKYQRCLFANKKKLNAQVQRDAKWPTTPTRWSQKRFKAFLTTIYSFDWQCCVQLGILYSVRNINTVASQFLSFTDWVREFWTLKHWKDLNLAIDTVWDWTAAAAYEEITSYVSNVIPQCQKWMLAEPQTSKVQEKLKTALWHRHGRLLVMARCFHLACYIFLLKSTALKCEVTSSALLLQKCRWNHQKNDHRCLKRGTLLASTQYRSNKSQQYIRGYLQEPKHMVSWS